jgi:hypothetical protein
MPRKFRLIIHPGEVQAIQLTPESVKRAATWCGGVEVVETDPHDSKLKFVALNIPTARGVLRAEEGWWIIKDADGTMHVMGPEEFAHTYMEAPDNGAA